MCTYAKIAYGLLDDVRNSTIPLDTVLFFIFFVPSIGAFVFSLGTGMLIHAHVEYRDRKHAEEYAKYLKSIKVAKPAKASKKRRPH